MKYEFDVASSSIKRRSLYDEEFRLIQELVDDKHKNLKLEYEDDDVARVARVTIWRYVKKENLPVIVTRTKNIVYVMMDQERIK